MPRSDDTLPVLPRRSNLTTTGSTGGPTPANATAGGKRTSQSEGAGGLGARAGLRLIAVRSTGVEPAPPSRSLGAGHAPHPKLRLLAHTPGDKGHWTNSPAQSWRRGLQQSYLDVQPARAPPRQVAPTSCERS